MVYNALSTKSLYMNDVGVLQKLLIKNLNMKILKLSPKCPLTVEWSSRQGEFHPKPLTEPYVTVSRHTALLDRFSSKIVPV